MSVQTAAKTLDGLTLEDIVKAVAATLQPDLQLELSASEEPQAYVPDVTVKVHKALADYPDILQAKHCRAILGLSEAKTYEVLNSKKCPSFTVGKRILVRKEAFITFLEANEGQDLID